MWNNILQYNIDWETSQKANINYYPWYEYKLIKDFVLGEGEKQTYTHESNWTYLIVYTNTNVLDTSSNNLTILSTLLILLTIPVHSIVMYELQTQNTQIVCLLNCMPVSICDVYCESHVVKFWYINTAITSQGILGNDDRSSASKREIKTGLLFIKRLLNKNYVQLQTMRCPI